MLQYGRAFSLSMLLSTLDDQKLNHLYNHSRFCNVRKGALDLNNRIVSIAAGLAEAEYRGARETGTAVMCEGFGTD
jgi:hypothetical protein